MLTCLLGKEDVPLTKTASLRVLRISENSIIRLNPPSFVKLDSRKYACECPPKNSSWVPKEISMSTTHISPSKNVSGRSKYTKPIIFSPEILGKLPIDMWDIVFALCKTSLKKLPLLKFNDISNPSNHHANLWLPIIFEFPSLLSLISSNTEITEPNIKPSARYLNFSTHHTSKAGVLETASKLRKMKSMPARVKIQAVEAKAEDPPRFRGATKSYPRVSGYKTHPKAGEIFLHNIQVLKNYWLGLMAANPEKNSWGW